MQPLIDADVLCYEIGYAAEAGWQHPGFPTFDYVQGLLDNRIGNICAMVEATRPPILYFTGKGNFRNEIAKRHKYKDRPSLKPWHYYNIKAYLKFTHEYEESVGMEADDLMAIEQTKRQAVGEDFCGPPLPASIICTRDKDLRAVPGWHYGWELGNQPQFGPLLVDEKGSIRLAADRKSIKGEGLLFFWSQCLTGDKVDTIPGLDGCGAVGAFNILQDCKDPTDAFTKVLTAYREKFGDSAEEELLEQGRLLWMTRQLNENGEPVLWELPKLENEYVQS